VPIENERKFLLLESGAVEREIAVRAEQTLRIEQKYLVIEKGLSVRVRVSTNDGTPSYRLTFKKDVKGQVVEVETPVSEDDFTKLWTTGCNKVIKTRYIYQGWEVDFFKTAAGETYLAVAEVELLPWQKTPNHIPELISNYIIFPVPANDRRFSNKKLGNIKYATKLLSEIKKISNSPHINRQDDLKTLKKKIK